MTLVKRVIEQVVKHRWLILIAALSFAVRMYWVTKVHPPKDFIYSDMLGYLGRGERVATLGLWDQPRPDEILFPIGTHLLMGGFIEIFGRDLDLMGRFWALLSTPIPVLAYLIVGRLYGGADWNEEDEEDGEDGDEQSGLARSGEPSVSERRSMARTAARVAGLFMVVYYPLLSYTGYFLSEIPFTLALTLAAYLSLRLVDHGRLGDAVALGLTVALGTLVRSQMLAAFGLMLVFVLWRRKLFPKLRIHHLLVAIVPIVLALGFHAVIAEHHTGRATVVAQNGALNRVFGRCHNHELRAHRAMFGPPAFGALHRNEQQNPDAWLKLKPALGESLTVEAAMWDEDAMHELANRCVEATSIGRQAYYAMTHVVLLWGYHVAWPDMAHPAMARHMRGWTRAHLLVFALPAIIGLAMGASRRHPRHGVVAMYVWSMFLVVMLYMGSARLRMPYDVLTVALALDVYARFADRMYAFWLRVRGAPAVQYVEEVVEVVEEVVEDDDSDDDAAEDDELEDDEALAPASKR